MQERRRYTSRMHLAVSLRNNGTSAEKAYHAVLCVPHRDPVHQTMHS